MNINAIPQILIERFASNADAILARFGELVSDEMLKEISLADYGMRAEEAFEELMPIRDLVRIPVPMRGSTREVLELTRWSTPESEPSHVCDREHLKRAFACAALLRSAAEPESANHDYGDNQTLIQLIESVLYLKRGLPEATASFLTWRIPSLAIDDEHRPFFVFGLISIAILLHRDALSTDDLESFVAFVEESERAVRDPMGVCPPEMFPGSFLNETIFNMRHATWRRLAAQVRNCVPESERIAELTRRIESKKRW